jgi:hypothetical protein
MKERIEKLNTGSRRCNDPSTASVPVNNGRTAAEGERQGRAGNSAFNDQLGETARRDQPGNRPYYPQ